MSVKRRSGARETAPARARCAHATPATPTASESATIIKTLTYREAKQRYAIGHKLWRAIKDGKHDNWQPRGAGRAVAHETVARVLESVKDSPHLATLVRARQLHVRTETVQAILTKQGLGRLTARLKHAGYQVDVVPPLAAARRRRIVATSPGCYTAADFKRFGVVRRVGTEKNVEVSGCCVVDHFTGWATCRVAATQTSADAVAGISKHVAAAPFPVRGILLTDNGTSFLSDEFIIWAASSGLVQRTTRFQHPWSNGKVEALNKTLKYQCFPPLVAGGLNSLDELQTAVDAYLLWFNTVRAHTGWLNKGLPPMAMWRNWEATKGSALERLVAMGILSPKDLQHLRVMGADPNGQPRTDIALADKGVPFAFVVDYNDARVPRVDLKDSPPKADGFVLT